jgi:hypothetical protein
MKNFIEWIFSTRVGKFIFLLVFSGMAYVILSLSSTSFRFIPMMIGGVIVSIILSTTDTRLKWF